MFRCSKNRIVKWRGLSGLAAGSFVLLLVSEYAGAEGSRAEKMSSGIVQVHGFTVVGITARTNNSREATPDGVIGKLWDRLMQEDLLTKIPNRADGNIVAIYTDYDSDHNGDYTFILGAKVTQASSIPAGMVVAKVATGKYADFTSERGPASKVVPEVWRKINSLPNNVPGGDRTYRSDFEVYDQRARNPQGAIVEVFIGVR